MVIYSHLDPYPYPRSSLYLVTAPTLPAVSLTNMKKHLRVDHTDDDADIEEKTQASIDILDGRDGRLGVALMRQTWDLAMSGFPCSWLRLPLPPLISVDSVKYYDGNNVLQTYDAAKYQVIGAGIAAKRARIILNSGQAWPVTYCREESVVVRFTAGYVDTGNSPATGRVPGPILSWIKLNTGTLYNNRETIVVGQPVVEIPQSLLQDYRDYEH